MAIIHEIRRKWLAYIEFRAHYHHCDVLTGCRWDRQQRRSVDDAASPIVGLPYHTASLLSAARTWRVPNAFRKGNTGIAMAGAQSWSHTTP
jgi:hypothetical protein